MKPSQTLHNLSRTELLIGKEKTEKIRGAAVIVVGLGAVGSYACEALARGGVGKMRLVDFDTIRPTNLNRNLLALTTTIGLAKVDIAADRVHAINPASAVERVRAFAAVDSFDQILEGHFDLVIDAIDSVGPKAALLIACATREIAVISSMGAALRTDPSHIKTGDIFDTHGCPLAEQIRTRLRRAGIGRGLIRAVYSNEPVAGGIAEPDETADGGDEYQRGRVRRRLGSLPTVTAIFGLTVGHHALAHLAGGFTLQQ